jgi:hypothetical protein
MRLASQLVIIFVICILAITLPAAPAEAAGAEITLSPSSGVPGENITVYGYNFTASDYVDIYYDVNGDDHWTSDEWMTDVRAGSGGNFDVTFEVPESYKGAHTVMAEDEEGVDAYADLTVKPGLIISAQEGPVGTTVNVEGVGFAEDEEHIELLYYSSGSSEVMENGIPADENGSWQCNFQIPPSAQGSHKIDAQGDDSRLNDVRDATFTVTAGISLSALSGSPGNTITVTGNGFVANERDIKVLFDEEPVETGTEIIRADDAGHWDQNFEVPEMREGTYTVTAEGEWTEDITPLSFEIGPGLILSPNQGHVGTNLTVKGGGFPSGKNVVIKYDGGQEATAPTNSNGSFTTIFPVPESRHGAHSVTAEVNGEVEANTTFTMESDAPGLPELISPADESRVGLIGGVRPTFKWSAVPPDPSGVYYSLQIAASANVTTAGNFTDPLISIRDIVTTNYTLNATEALPYGTYYWIVQAVDGAENAGSWTVAQSFRAGLLPLWAFIAIIVAIVALAGTLIYFFVIRKRIYYY